MKIAEHSLQKRLTFEIMLAVLLAVLSALLTQLQVLQRWDNLIYDLESAEIKRPVDDNIVIVAIDDVSLQKLGRWPWSRNIHATLLDQLTAADVAAIGLDVLFIEPDLMHPENDRQLGEAIRRNGHVVLPVLAHEYGNNIIVTKPLAEIADAAQLAHVNMHFDTQGVVRRLDLLLELNNDQTFPAMSLALSRQLNGYIDPPDLATRENSLIAFAGPPGQFRQISYVDVLQDAGVRQSLQGKIILIGATAAGLGSRIATPVSKNRRLMPGIEFQANALAAIQSGRVIRPVEWPVYTLLTLILIVIPVLRYRLLKPNAVLLLILGSSILTCATSFYLLSTLQLWFAPLPTLVCLFLSYPLWILRKLEQLGRELFEEHEKTRATLKAIGDSVISTDKKGCIEYMNPAAEKMFACTLAEVRNKPFTEICKIIEQNEAAILGSHDILSKAQQGETRIIRNRQEKEYAISVSSSPVKSENGLLAGTVYALSDLTEIVSINRKVAFIATHDEMTGLPNRVLLSDRLGQAISNAVRKNSTFAVLFIDLDDFKKINDGMGHRCGDLVLQQVAGRFRSMIRDSDTVSRWGGDEFIILLENLTFPADASDVATKIIQSLSQSFLVDKQEVFVSPSIGISLYPEDAQQAEELLAKADTAMYSVKKDGNNNFCFYSQDLEYLVKERLVMEKDLRQSLQQGEFEIHYQPQIDLASDRLSGAEALIRWRHPEKGLIAPDKFIPLAEETGLIVPIGEWVIKTVCQQLKSWQEKGLPVVKVAINLSARQFVQKDLVNIIIQEIARHGIASNLLQMEITESMMIQDVDRVIQILGDLKSTGLSIAIDDFGTGYSSLENLKRFPIDKLKIDKSFISNVLHNNDDASIVQTVIALGQNMNMQVIAEGVENEEQVRFLQEHQCDFGQGYFFSKPVPAQEMEKMIEKFKQMGKI